MACPRICPATITGTVKGQQCKPERIGLPRSDALHMTEEYFEVSKDSREQHITRSLWRKYIMVPMFRTILSPVDFNDNSLPALNYAAVFAQQFEARSYLLHVVQTDAGHLRQELQHITKNEWLAESIATDRLKRIALDKLGERIRYEVLVRTGEPVQSILDTAIDIEADLIVMATHGRSGLSHFFLGSVTERVVREASCPVFTIRGGLRSPAMTTGSQPKVPDPDR